MTERQVDKKTKRQKDKNRKRKNMKRQKDDKIEMFEGSIAMIYRFLLTRYSHHIFFNLKDRRTIDRKSD